MDVALRYGVDDKTIRRWNGIDENVLMKPLCESLKI